MKSFVERSKNGLLHKLIQMSVKRSGRAYERRILQAAKNPEALQLETLRRILQKQSGTLFAQAHHFDAIRSVADFRAQVPVQGYEDLRPWIERQDASGEKALNSEPLLMYAMTSGTTGKPKYIPIHENSLEAYNRIQKFFIYNLMRHRPNFLKGHILAVVSPAIEGRMEASGIPYGSTSGHIYEGVSPLIKKKYLVPVEVFGIANHDLKYLTILRLALQYADLSYISTANPSTVSRLLVLANENWDALIDDIEQGEFHELHRLSRTQAEAVRKRLRPDLERAAELRALPRGNDDRVKLRDIWPNLQAIGCWTGGSCSIFLEQWKNELPAQTLIQEIGYLSSEFRGTVPVAPGKDGLPTVVEHFLEFVERDDWEAGRGTFKGVHELEDGQEYYIFVTSDTGLYRYDINDIVRVDGFWHNLPRLAFMQKGKGVTNITGEKLYESQVLEAVRRVEARFNLKSDFYMSFADEERAEYQLCYQPAASEAERTWSLERVLAKEIDDEISAINLEYATKRKSGRLKPLRLRVLSARAFDEFKKFSIARGQREGQFKIVALQYRKSVPFDFESHLYEPALGEFSAAARVASKGLS